MALDQVILTQSKVDNLSSSSTSSTTETTEGWEHGKYEVGRRVVTESATGEEVSIRNIKLDTDGGEAENILLEEGVHFTHKKLQSQSLSGVEGGKEGEQEQDESLTSTLLHPVDQSIILSLCLDVGNSNPAVCSCSPFPPHSCHCSSSLFLLLLLSTTVGWFNN
jgi:hypothetical protein